MFLLLLCKKGSVCSVNDVVKYCVEIVNLFSCIESEFNKKDKKEKNMKIKKLLATFLALISLCSVMVISASAVNNTEPYQFEARIYVSSKQTGSYVDCSSYTWDGYARSKAIVTRGSRGLIRQDIYEIFGYGAYGQIWGTKAPNGTTGTAKGCWSVDSVGTYNYYNHVL